MGGIVVAFKPVLWSPVGAPAGVPGPRRNADDCDAGWFAPVATRRRPIFGAFQAPSPRLAVSPGGRPPGAPRWAAGSGRHPLTAQVLGGSPRGPEGASGPWDLLVPGSPPAPNPLPLFFPLAASVPCHLRCLDSSVAGRLLATGCSEVELTVELQVGRLCPAEPVAATAGGCLGAEFCPRPGHPPGGASPAAEST